MTRKTKKSKPKKNIIYKSLSDVKCPVCDGIINHKWFNFRTGQVVEFIAECWNYDNHNQHHIFYFQIEVPECVILDAKNGSAFNK